MKKYFFIYFLNDDTRTFNVKGPYSDDREVTKRTASLQSYGLHVRINTSNHVQKLEQMPSLEEAIKLGPKGYKLDSNLKWDK